MIINSDIKNELEEIRQQNFGILYPEKVIEYAKNPETKLHNKFEWDNNQAAHEYRIIQAQQIIRVVVTVIPNSNQETRMYVSLSNDRTIDGAYRYIVDVLSDDATKSQLIKDVLSELKSFQRKFAILQNVSEHFHEGINILKEMEEKLSKESKPVPKKKPVDKSLLAGAVGQVR